MPANAEWASASIEEPNERQRHRRNVRRQHQYQHEHSDEPDVHLGDVPHVGLRDGAGHGEHACDGRRLLAESQVDGDDDSELDGTDYHCLDQRHHDRHHQDDGGGGVQEQPKNEEEDVQQHQHHPLAVAQRAGCGGEVLRCLDLGQVHSEQRGGGHEQHHHRRLDDAVHHGGVEVLQVQLAVDEGVNHDGDEARLGGAPDGGYASAYNRLHIV